MAPTRVVLWSPIETDRYAVIGPHIEVFDGGARVLHDTSVLTAAPAAADWCRVPSLEGILGIGLVTGQVVLLDVSGVKPSVQQLGLRRKRMCSAVSFSPNSPHLAEALRERSRDESGLVVWDVSTGQMAWELGNADAAVSVDWMSGPAPVLVAGSVKSWLRVYDLRAPQPDAAAMSAVASAREVRAVACDRRCDWRVASVDGEEPVVKLWDVRRLKAPVSTLVLRAPGAALAWSPARDDALAVLCAGDRVLSLWDVRASRAVRTAACAGPLSAFALHPQNPDRVLLCGDSVVDCVLHPRLPITFSATGVLALAAGNVVRTVAPLADDVLARMRSRAGRGYGMDARVNAALAEEDGDAELAFVWRWVDRCFASMPTDGARIVQAGVVATVLDGSSSASVTPEARTAAQRACMWGFADRESLAAAVRALEARGERERAAAYALWHNDVQLAAAALAGSADPVRSMAALALAGHTASGELWHALCQQQAARERNAYMRAAFAFLGGGAAQDSFRSILRDPAVDLADRAAFACRYLPEAELRTWLTQTLDELVARAALPGLLLAGIGDAGAPLLAAYIDRTGDVQTAALLCAVTAAAPGAQPVRDRRPARWIETYREALDAWSMWEQRALLDVARAATTPAHPAQVVPRCTFCNAAIAHSAGALGARGGAARARGARPAACGSCRKALPLCGVCLLPLGTPASAEAAAPATEPEGWRNHSVVFDCWFTWCQYCRHGGHAAHMTEWFSSHDVCPVADCSCRCASLDG